MWTMSSGEENRMRKKFVIKWIYFGQIFIGAGIIFGLEHVGITIGNLFIGFEEIIEK